MNVPGPAPARRKVRVLVADDSLVMRSLLRMVLESAPWIEVAALVRNGKEAVDTFSRIRPDLVMLDIEMPEMDGLDALAKIRALNPRVPVIMCSALTQRGARITLEALSRGATDYIAKPSEQRNVREGMALLSEQLLPRIAALTAEPASPPVSAPPPVSPVPAGSSPAAAAVELVVIGVSTGGPVALEAILPQLPASFPVPILIAQHMPQQFTEQLARRLDGLCSLRVREAADGSHPEPGCIDIARGDWHMELTSAARIRLNQNPHVNFCRPSVDVLFQSAVRVHGGRLLGVILTGMGSDGLAGCRDIRAAGGCVFAQDSATSVVWGMPGAVVHAGLANKVIALRAIAGEIARFVSTSLRKTA